MIYFERCNGKLPTDRTENKKPRQDGFRFEEENGMSRKRYGK